MAVGRLRLKTRGYDFPPWRPPSEAWSLLLRVTRGCPWNKCTFCEMYKTMSFERRPLEEILGDIEAARQWYGQEVRWVFIGDSDSLVVRPSFLVEVLRALYRAFPHLERVTSYARAKTLRKRRLEDLKELRRAGLTRLHVGLESGDREVLEAISKGVTPEEVIEAGRKAKEAGFELSLYVILGIGGKERWRQHASGTAQVLNQVDPHFIRVRTLVPRPGTPLYEQWQRGDFVMAEPEEILQEEERLVEDLEVTSHFLSDHISNYLPVEGKLPEDKERMLSMIRGGLEALRKDPSLKERYRQKAYLASL